METDATLRKLAEKWREAADEVAHPELRKCYAERARHYELLAAARPARTNLLDLSNAGEGGDR